MLLVTTTKNDGGSRGVKCEREPPNSFTVKTKLLHIWERGHNKRIDSRATKIRTTRFEHLNPGKEFILHGLRQKLVLWFKVGVKDYCPFHRDYFSFCRPNNTASS